MIEQDRVRVGKMQLFDQDEAAMSEGELGLEFGCLQEDPARSHIHAPRGASIQGVHSAATVIRVKRLVCVLTTEDGGWEWRGEEDRPAR